MVWCKEYQIFSIRVIKVMKSKLMSQVLPLFSCRLKASLMASLRNGDAKAHIYLTRLL